MRGIQIIFVAMLSIALASVVSIAGYYGIARRLPGPSLPDVIEETGITTPHFVFSIDNIVRPVSVAVSPDGERIFVTEGGGERFIHIFDYKGEHINKFAPPNTTPQSRAPAGIAIRSDGLVFVVDSILRDIAIYSYDGEFVGIFMPDNDPAFDWMPVGVTIDKEGNLYVTDQLDPRHQVLVFDPEGNLKLRFGYFGIGEGLFSFPTDIAVSDDGDIYVADTNNSRLQVFDAQGQFKKIIAGDIALPRGISFDQRGRLHVVDSLRHEVTVFSVQSNAEWEAKYGTLGIERGQFRFPFDLAFDGKGWIYITDHLGNRIQVWSF